MATILSPWTQSSRPVQGRARLNTANPLARGALFSFAGHRLHDGVRSIYPATVGTVTKTTWGKARTVTFAGGNETGSNLNYGTQTGPLNFLHQRPFTMAFLATASQLNEIALACLTDANSDRGWSVGYHVGQATSGIGLSLIRSTTNVRKAISNTITAGVPFTVVFTYDGTEFSVGVDIYFNGVLGTVLSQVDAAGTTGAATAESLYLGRRRYDTVKSHNGQIFIALISDWKWGPQHAAAFHNDPWQIFSNQGVGLPRGRASGGGGGLSVVPAGMTSVGAFGTTVVTRGSVSVSPAGIVSVGAFGTDVVTRGPVSVLPGGIPTAFASGTAAITVGSVNISPAGIASLLAFGTLTVGRGAVTVAPAGVASAGAFGTQVVTPGAVTLSPSSIASLLAFGTAALSPGAVSVAPSGIPSVLAFGTSVVARGAVNISPASIASLLAFGAAVVSPGAATIAPAGIVSAGAFGVALVGAAGSVMLLPAGIGSTEAFGTAALARGAVIVAPSGIGSALAFGAALVSPGALVLGPAAIGSVEAFGTALLTTGGVQVFPLGIGPGEAFGAPGVARGAVTLGPGGVPSAEAFGTLTSQPQAVLILPAGIASAAAVGEPVLFQISDQTVIAIAIAGGEAFGAVLLVGQAAPLFRILGGPQPKALPQPGATVAVTPSQTRIRWPTST